MSTFISARAGGGTTGAVTTSGSGVWSSCGIGDDAAVAAYAEVRQQLTQRCKGNKVLHVHSLASSSRSIDEAVFILGGTSRFMRVSNDCLLVDPRLRPPPRPRPTPVPPPRFLGAGAGGADALAAGRVEVEGSDAATAVPNEEHIYIRV